MGRFFVPAVFVATISGIAFGLIVGIVARSPETHANVRPEGYERTPIIYVGDEPAFSGFGLADPGMVTNVDQGTRGRLLFMSNSCVACHGLAMADAVGAFQRRFIQVRAASADQPARKDSVPGPAYLPRMPVVKRRAGQGLRHVPGLLPQQLVDRMGHRQILIMPVEQCQEKFPPSIFRLTGLCNLR